MRCSMVCCSSGYVEVGVVLRGGESVARLSCVVAMRLRRRVLVARASMMDPLPWTGRHRSVSDCRSGRP